MQKQRTRASTVCIHDGRLLVIKLEDPHTKEIHTYIPGGKVERDEYPWQAAERETLEETGYHVTVDKQSESLLHYPFTWNGEEIACSTYFFKARLTPGQQNPQKVDDAPYHRGVFWLNLDQFDSHFSWHGDIYREIKRFIKP